MRSRNTSNRILDLRYISLPRPRAPLPRPRPSQRTARRTTRSERDRPPVRLDRPPENRPSTLALSYGVTRAGALRDRGARGTGSSCRSRRGLEHPWATWGIADDVPTLLAKVVEALRNAGTTEEMIASAVKAGGEFENAPPRQNGLHHGNQMKRCMRPLGPTLPSSRMNPRCACDDPALYRAPAAGSLGDRRMGRCCGGRGGRRESPPL